MPRIPAGSSWAQDVWEEVSELQFRTLDGKAEGGLQVEKVRSKCKKGSGAEAERHGPEGEILASSDEHGAMCMGRGSRGEDRSPDQSGMMAAGGRALRTR